MKARHSLKPLLRLIASSLLFAVAAMMDHANAQERPSPSIGPADLYVLAIGMGEYEDGELGDIASAETSAKVVAAALAQRGARHVSLLTSHMTAPEGPETGFMVTRDDVRQAIVELKEQIREDDPINPRIIIYMMGHGAGDPDFDLLFALPSDYAGSPNQDLSLVQRTVLSLDVISSLVYFRLHPSMSGWDGLFLPGDIMPDLADREGSIRRILETSQKIALAEQSGNSSAPRVGNPPVPFLLLFDNCSDEVQQNLYVDGRFILPLMEGSLRELTKEGLVFYAAQPGSQENDVELPSELLEGLNVDVASAPRAGPLGRRLLEILNNNQQPITMEELGVAMRSPVEGYYPGDRVWMPHHHSGELLADVGPVEFLPGAGGPVSQLRVLP